MLTFPTKERDSSVNNHVEDEKDLECQLSIQTTEGASSTPERRKRQAMPKKGALEATKVVLQPRIVSDSVRT